jgi:hypothetical protein
MAKEDKGGLVECACSEPTPFRIISWSTKSAKLLCKECGGLYERTPTNKDYYDFFINLLPPTLDR